MASGVPGALRSRGATGARPPQNSGTPLTNAPTATPESTTNASTHTHAHEHAGRPRGRFSFSRPLVSAIGTGRGGAPPQATDPFNPPATHSNRGPIVLLYTLSLSPFHSPRCPRHHHRGRCTLHRSFLLSLLFPTPLSAPRHRR